MSVVKRKSPGDAHVLQDCSSLITEPIYCVTSATTNDTSCTDSSGGKQPRLRARDKSFKTKPESFFISAHSDETIGPMGSCSKSSCSMLSPSAFQVSADADSFPSEPNLGSSCDIQTNPVSNRAGMGPSNPELEPRINEAVVELDQVSALSLTVNFVKQFLASRHGSLLLPKLMLCDLIEHASFGDSVVTICGRMDSLNYTNLLWNEAPSENVGSRKVVWRELMEALQNATPAERGNVVQFWEDPTEVSTELPEPIRMLNQIGIRFEEFLSMMQDLANVYERPCDALGHGCAPANLVFQLAAPLLAHRALPPTVLEMLPLILQLRQTPSISMHGQDSTPYGDYVDSWTEWLRHHPAVERFLDPHYCIVQPTAAVVAPPGLQRIFQRYPRDIPAPTVYQLPQPALAAPAGGPLPHVPINNLYTCLTAHDASLFASILRQNFANGLGGGGPGAQHTIFTFSTNQALAFWD